MLFFRVVGVVAERAVGYGSKEETASFSSAGLSVPNTAIASVNSSL